MNPKQAYRATKRMQALAQKQKQKDRDEKATQREAEKAQRQNHKHQMLSEGHSPRMLALTLLQRIQLQGLDPAPRAQHFRTPSVKSADEQKAVVERISNQLYVRFKCDGLLQRIPKDWAELISSSKLQVRAAGMVNGCHCEYNSSLPIAGGGVLGPPPPPGHLN